MLAMNVNREELIAALSAVALAASTDVTRALCGVHLRRTPNAAGTGESAWLVAEASNGHWLAQWRLAAAFTGADAAIVALESVKPLIAWLKTSRAESVAIDFKARTVTDDAGGGASFAVRESVFPPVDTVIALCDTTHEQCPAEVLFATEYLAAVTKAFSFAARLRGDRTMQALRFRFGADVLDPLRVTCSKAPELIAVLMPVRP